MHSLEQPRFTCASALRLLILQVDHLCSIVLLSPRWIWKGGFICTIRWPHPQVRSFLGHFWGVVPNFAFNKVVPPWIWLWIFWRRKVGKGTATRCGCRIKKNWSRQMAKHTSKCLYWSATPMPAASCALLTFLLLFFLYEQNNPPKYLGNKSEIPHLNFTTPPMISAWGNPHSKS